MDDFPRAHFTSRLLLPGCPGPSPGRPASWIGFSCLCSGRPFTTCVSRCSLPGRSVLGFLLDLSFIVIPTGVARLFPPRRSLARRVTQRRDPGLIHPHSSRLGRLPNSASALGVP